MRWLDSIPNSMDMNLSKLGDTGDRSWHAAVHRLKRAVQDLATKEQQQINEIWFLSFYPFKVNYSVASQQNGDSHFIVHSSSRILLRNLISWTSS